MMFLVSVAVLGYVVTGVVAQSEFKFTVPVRANDRAKVVGAAGSQGIVTGILHPNLGAGGAYTVVVNYYVPGCTGSPLTTVPLMDSTVTTSIDVGGLYLSQVTNPLATIRGYATTTTPGFYVDTVGATAGTSKTYQFCVEYVLRDSSLAVLDQERYDVQLQATNDGAVSTDAVVITDLATNPDATTFTARAYICTVTGAAASFVYTPVNPNFFQGDTVTICFESVNYPEASIIGFATTDGLQLIDGANSYDIKPTATDPPSSDVADNSCTPTAGGVQRCAVAVTLTGTNTDTIFVGVPTAASAKTVLITGTMTMQFGFVRRNVRVLFQAGETFPRNTKTTMTIVGGTNDKDDGGCSACSEWFFLFKIICWILKCLFGF